MFTKELAAKIFSITSQWRRSNRIMGWTFARTSFRVTCGSFLWLVCAQKDSLTNSMAFYEEHPVKDIQGYVNVTYTWYLRHFICSTASVCQISTFNNLFKPNKPIFSISIQTYKILLLYSTQLKYLFPSLNSTLLQSGVNKDKKNPTFMAV